VKTKTEIADKQAGLRQGRGTRDQITNLRILMHKACEHQQPLYMCFVNFKKAFHYISHDKFCNDGYGISSALDLLAGQTAKLYRKQLAKVKAAVTLSEWFSVSPKKSCPLSVLVQHLSEDGDEADPRWILRWTTNWTANDHEPSLLLMTSSCWPLRGQNYKSWWIA